MRFQKQGSYWIWVMLTLMVCSCKTGADEVEPNQVKVELENHLETSGTSENITLPTGEQVTVVPADGWITFDVPITIPGRYQTVVQLQSRSGDTVTCWVEDYIDNNDDRQYNITGSMKFPPLASLTSTSIDGSPLDKGTHKMKMHIAGGDAAVDWITFTLLKPHQVTPEVLIQETSGENWQVVWADEFDNDGPLDTTKWTYDIGNWGWGNNELQYYTEGRQENARIENGHLIIEARKNDMDQTWTSARLTTRGKTSFIYGRIELMAKVPKKRGNWAAGWTLGDAYVDEIDWPYCGEIDIMESVGFELDDETGDGTAHASVHCGAYYFKLNNHHTAITDVKNMNEEFHLYSIDWTPDYIKAYVDDELYFTYDDTSDSLTWPFSEPQNIILNLAMGGGWGGARGMDESVVAQKIVVDYVRVYERR